MANGTVTPTVVDQWFDGERTHVIGTMTVNAGNYATNGIVCSFAGLVKGNSQAPKYCNINGVAGFQYRFTPGTDASNGLFLIYVEATVSTNTPLAQHSVAAIVSGVTGDTISFYAVFGMGR